MGVLAEGLEHLFQPVQRAAGKDQRLLGVTQRHTGIEFERADDDDLTIVVVAVGGRASGHTCVCGLADDNAVSRHSGLKYLPERQQGGGLKDRQRRALTKANTRGEAFDLVRLAEHPRVGYFCSEFVDPAGVHRASQSKVKAPSAPQSASPDQAGGFWLMNTPGDTTTE